MKDGAGMHRVLWVGMVELLWATVLSLYGQQRRQRVAAQMEAAGAEAVGQVRDVERGVLDVLPD